MVYCINMGFVIEQALIDIIKRYIDQQRFDDVYGNFHISVTNQHPFAHLMIDKNARASDTFPSIVVSSHNDSKPNDLNNLPPQVYEIGLTSSELETLTNLNVREKTKIDENGEIVQVKKNGVVQTEKIPGFILVTDKTAIETLKELADSRTVDDTAGMVYGLKIDTRRRDRISVEVWAESNQLKNEIYEHLRLLITSSLNLFLQQMYKPFNPSLFDGSINGERGSNYNFDFDCLLCGSHLSFDIDYDLSQIFLDTEINGSGYKDIIPTVFNHVKW